MFPCGAHLRAVQLLFLHYLKPDFSVRAFLPTFSCCKCLELADSEKWEKAEMQQVPIQSPNPNSP